MNLLKIKIFKRHKEGSLSGEGLREFLNGFSAAKKNRNLIQWAKKTKPEEGYRQAINFCKKHCEVEFMTDMELEEYCVKYAKYKYHSIGKLSESECKFMKRKYGINVKSNRSDFVTLDERWREEFEPFKSVGMRKLAVSLD